MTLTDFLLARIAEDESVARSALHAARWTAIANDHGGDLSQPVTAEVRTEPYVSTLGGESSRLVCLVGPGDEMPSLTHATYDARHIARHDPARVLAECEAKRRIIEMHGPMPDEDVYCETCDGHDTWPCLTLRLLAMPYADHPDYREEWRA